MTRALLFDLDGTLIDSMPHHQAAWGEWHRLREMPFDSDAFFTATAGRRNEEIFADLLPGLPESVYTRYADEKEALYRKIAASELQLIPGFDALRDAARARDMKLAICTASTPENMALAFELFALHAHVDTITSPADGLRGKPHPDIFEEAARRLAIAPADCIVFEDAPLGVEAARRAGMRAVALTTSLPAEAFAEFDNLIAVVPDFTALDIGAVLSSTGPTTPKER